MNRSSRKRLLWRPLWSSKYEKWTAIKITQNLWRFDAIEGFEDVMQEAKLLFYTLGNYYPVVNNDAHFFCLYKTSLLRKFHDKSRIRQKSVIDQDVCADDIAEVTLGSTVNSGHLSLLLEELPDELKTVLRALTTGRVRRKLDRPTPKLLPRENHNMRLKRRFQLTVEDPVGALKNYFINS